MLEFTIAFVNAIAPLLNDALLPAELTGNIQIGLAALGVGVAALGAGIAEGGIGAAAVGAIAEDSDFFGIGLLFTVLPETLVILAIVVIFLVQ
ncbi:MAG: F0F1 ATP synthase subunit C [Halarchaeum sp.]